MTEATFWRGEPCEARKVNVMVGKPPRPTWWCYGIVGERRHAVVIDAPAGRELLDDEDGSGWQAVTTGKGMPGSGGRYLPLTSTPL